MSLSMESSKQWWEEKQSSTLSHVVPSAPYTSVHCTLVITTRGRPEKDQRHQVSRLYISKKYDGTDRLLKIYSRDYVFLELQF